MYSDKEYEELAEKRFKALLKSLRKTKREAEKKVFNKFIKEIYANHSSKCKQRE